MEQGTPEKGEPEEKVEKGDWPGLAPACWDARTDMPCRPDRTGLDDCGEPAG